jgi:NADP-dependent 3-hydroxy acid dehydrogenase YdfG
MNKTILISGASSGIGRAAAEAFAARSYRLIIAGRRKERLQELATRLQATYKAEVLCLSFDLQDGNSVHKAISGLPDEWKEIDILVNNAGLAVGMSPLHEGSFEDWDRMIDTNIKGLAYLSREVVPLMVAREKGHVINIGSIAGKETYINGNVYCATKHAVDSLTKAMRMELVKYGIRVTQIAPGAVETEFSEVRFKGDKEAAAKVYLGFQPLKPEDVAGAIVYVAELPAHVCVNDMLIMPTAQANTVHWNKKA